MLDIPEKNAAEEEALEAISVEGALQVLADEFTKLEPEARKKFIKHLVENEGPEGVHAITTALVKMQEMILEEASIDPTTGVMSNQYFRQYELSRLESVYPLESGSRTGDAVSIIFIDVDSLGILNKKCGSKHGDAYLRTVAQKIAEVTRQGDIVARYGGDEFLVVLLGVDEDTINVVFERYEKAVDVEEFSELEEVRRGIIESGKDPRYFQPGVSMGFAVKKSGETLKGCISEADDMMQYHKTKRKEEQNKDV
ncbi:GGDEF domain-containing protein [Candidatus Saccharibacteria bacterium CPR2]|nr:GGDEF domain-containing protein [Candidatus Saccharibacteria bacterium CPR2]